MNNLQCPALKNVKICVMKRMSGESVIEFVRIISMYIIWKPNFSDTRFKKVKCVLGY